MQLLEPLEQLEIKEEQFRSQVNSLLETQRKEFYKLQSKKLKDPDSYAALNWFFLGGIHHFYLGKYTLFTIELTLFIISLIGLFLDYSSFVYILILLSIYELPQLFFSQKIVRQYNYNLSCEIFNEVNKLERKTTLPPT